MHLVQVLPGFEVDAAGVKGDALACKNERFLVSRTLEVFADDEFWFFRRAAGYPEHAAHAKAADFRLGEHAYFESGGFSGRNCGGRKSRGCHVTPGRIGEHARPVHFLAGDQSFADADLDLLFIFFLRGD